LFSNLLFSAWLNCGLLLRGWRRFAEEGTVNRRRVTVRSGFVPSDSQRMTASRNHIGWMKVVGGVKSRRRACARQRGREPECEMKGQAHGYLRATARSPASWREDEPKGAPIASERRQAK